MDPTFNPSSWQHWALILSLVIFVVIGYSQAAAEDRRIRLLRQTRATVGSASPLENRASQPRPATRPAARPPAQPSSLPSNPGWLALNRYLPAPKRQRPEMEYIPERDDRAYGYSDPAYSNQNYTAPTYSPPAPEQPQPVVPRGNPFPEPVGTPFPAPETKTSKVSKAKAKSGKSKALKSSPQSSAPIDDIPSTPTEIVYDSTPVSRSAAPEPAPYRPLVTKAPGASPFLDIPKDRWPL